MKTIAEMETEVSRTVESSHHFDGFQAKATAYGPQRKKKSTAPESAFQPGRDRFVIEYVPAASVPARRSVAALIVPTSPAVSRQPYAAAPAVPRAEVSSELDHAADLIRALADAEARPGFHFVGLKWFRDVGLTQRGLSWASVPNARYTAVNTAIAQGCVIAEKLDNPNRPEHPTSVLKLNRSHPAVQAILNQPTRPGFNFPLVTVRGEPVSSTVIRDRGQR